MGQAGLAPLPPWPRRRSLLAPARRRRRGKQALVITGALVALLIVIGARPADPAAAEPIPAPAQAAATVDPAAVAAAAEAHRRALLAAALGGGTQFVWPVPGAPLSARYGETGPMWAHRHTGLDFNGHWGDPVLSVGDGRVVTVTVHPAYGNLVIVRAADGAQLYYAHLSSTARRIRAGALVQAGQELGRVGATGNAEGAHLHLEVRVGGIPTDPAEYLWGGHPGTPAPAPGWAREVYGG
ncbi:MAG: M23 family metallopeptidase [Actinomycetota bacterium]|nr:MAG: M23 family metallopeptidase [Actinomycetota bacterium]